MLNFYYKEKPKVYQKYYTVPNSSANEVKQYL